jgi:predicted transposase YdaD
MGLRYQPALVQKLLQGVLTMKESTTYQAILKEGLTEGKIVGKIEGKIEEARRILLLLGRDQLGEPSADMQAALDAITDVNRLEELTIRSKHVSSWQELLGSNGPGRRGRGRKKTT